MSTHRPPLAVLVAAGALVLGLPGTARAADEEAVVDQVVGRGDGTVDLTIAVTGGCVGTTTRTVSVRLPVSGAVVSVGDAAGSTHRVDGEQVTWQAGEPGARLPRTFSLTARLVAAPGDEVLLPTRLDCADGSSTAWTDTAPDGAHPAPRFTATADTVDDAGTEAVPVAADGEGGPGHGWLAAAVLLLPAATATAVVARRRRQGVS